MRIVDNLIALRIIYLLVTPIEDTDAFKLGLIDKDGKTIRKAKTSEETKATSMLHRLVWNLKRLISLAPGGSTKIGSMVAAYLLVKEAYENDWSEARLVEEVELNFPILEQIRFIEEEILFENCIEELKSMEEDAPANATGPAVSTDTPTKKQIVPLVKRKKQDALIRI